MRSIDIQDMSGKANIEVVNSTLGTPFTNANDNDVVFYPTDSNQSIHIGCVTSSNSMLKVTKSNVEIRNLYTPSNVTRYATASQIGGGVLRSAGATYNILSVTITTSGKPVLLMASGDFNPEATDVYCTFNFKRDTTSLTCAKQVSHASTTIGRNMPFSIMGMDTPAAGTYTYYIECYVGNGNATIPEGGMSLTAVELF